jgi:hypothetical protein
MSAAALAEWRQAAVRVAITESCAYCGPATAP